MIGNLHCPKCGADLDLTHEVEALVGVEARRQAELIARDKDVSPAPTQVLAALIAQKMVRGGDGFSIEMAVWLSCLEVGGGPGPLPPS